MIYGFKVKAIREFEVGIAASTKDEAMAVLCQSIDNGEYDNDIKSADIVEIKEA